MRRQLTKQETIDAIMFFFDPRSFGNLPKAHNHIFNEDKYYTHLFFDEKSVLAKSLQDPDIFDACEKNACFIRWPFIVLYTILFTTTHAENGQFSPKKDHDIQIAYILLRNLLRHDSQVKDCAMKKKQKSQVRYDAAKFFLSNPDVKVLATEKREELVAVSVDSNHQNKQDPDATRILQELLPI